MAISSIFHANGWSECWSVPPTTTATTTHKYDAKQQASFALREIRYDIQKIINFRFVWDNKYCRCSVCIRIHVGNVNFSFSTHLNGYEMRPAAAKYSRSQFCESFFDIHRTTCADWPFFFASSFFYWLQIRDMKSNRFQVVRITRREWTRNERTKRAHACHNEFIQMN